MALSVSALNSTFSLLSFEIPILNDRLIKINVSIPPTIINRKKSHIDDESNTPKKTKGILSPMIKHDDKEIATPRY